MATMTRLAGALGSMIWSHTPQTGLTEKQLIDAFIGSQLEDLQHFKDGIQKAKENPSVIFYHRKDDK